MVKHTQTIRRQIVALALKGLKAKKKGKAKKVLKSSILETRDIRVNYRNSLRPYLCSAGRRISSFILLVFVV